MSTWLAVYTVPKVISVVTISFRGHTCTACDEKWCECRIYDRKEDYECNGTLKNHTAGARLVFNDAKIIAHHKMIDHISVDTLQEVMHAEKSAEVDEPQPEEEAIPRIVFLAFIVLLLMVISSAAFLLAVCCRKVCCRKSQSNASHKSDGWKKRNCVKRRPLTKTKLGKVQSGFRANEPSHSSSAHLSQPSTTLESSVQSNRIDYGSGEWIKVSYKRTSSTC